MNDNMRDGSFAYVVFTAEDKYYIFKKEDLKYRTYYIEIDTKIITESNDDLFPRHVITKWGSFSEHDFDEWLISKNLKNVWDSYEHH